jgi:hypothetical protein
MIHHGEMKQFVGWLKKFDGKPLLDWNDDITIVGIRDPSDQDKDIFNDKLLLVLNSQIYSVKGTTDPGKYWTDNAKKEWGVAGVAHLMEGWYPNVWTIGPHMGEEALVQYGNAVTVWRDVDKNYLFDPDIDQVQTGYFGINFHYTKGDPENIGRWSAGCQVVKIRSDWEAVLEMVKDTGVKWISYLLINKEDLHENYVEEFFG